MQTLFLIALVGLVTPIWAYFVAEYATLGYRVGSHRAAALIEKMKAMGHLK